MTRFLCAVAVAVVALSGCGKKNIPAKPVDPPDDGGVPTRSAEDEKASNDLKRLGLAYMNYNDAHDKGPAKPADLLPFVENDRQLMGSVERGTYVLAMNIKLMQLTRGSSNTVLGYVSTVPTAGGTVLMGDTSTRVMT